MSKLLRHFGALALLTASAGRASDDVYTVCQVLDGLQEYAGKIVNIHGLYSVSSESSAITDADCRQPRLLKGREWSPGIWIWTPGSVARRRLTQPVVFDDQAYNKLVRASFEAGKHGNVVSATFTGLLEYCPRYGKLRTGREVWLGCGFLGMHQLQLVIQTVSDLHEERGTH